MVQFIEEESKGNENRYTYTTYLSDYSHQTPPVQFILTQKETPEVRLDCWKHRNFFSVLTAVSTPYKQTPQSDMLPIYTFPNLQIMNLLDEPLWFSGKPTDGKKLKIQFRTKECFLNMHLISYFPTNPLLIFQVLPNRHVGFIINPISFNPVPTKAWLALQEEDNKKLLEKKLLTALDKQKAWNELQEATTKAEYKSAARDLTSMVNQAEDLKEDPQAASAANWVDLRPEPTHICSAPQSPNAAREKAAYAVAEKYNFDSAPQSPRAFTSNIGFITDLQKKSFRDPFDSSYLFVVPSKIISISRSLKSEAHLLPSPFSNVKIINMTNSTLMVQIRSLPGEVFMGSKEILLLRFCESLKENPRSILWVLKGYSPQSPSRCLELNEYQDPNSESNRLIVNEIPDVTKTEQIPEDGPKKESAAAEPAAPDQAKDSKESETAAAPKK